MYLITIYQLKKTRTVTPRESLAMVLDDLSGFILVSSIRREHFCASEGIMSTLTQSARWSCGGLSKPVRIGLPLPEETRTHAWTYVHSKTMSWRNGMEFLTPIKPCQLLLLLKPQVRRECTTEQVIGTTRHSEGVLKPSDHDNDQRDLRRKLSTVSFEDGPVEGASLSVADDAEYGGSSSHEDARMNSGKKPSLYWLPASQTNTIR